MFIPVAGWGAIGFEPVLFDMSDAHKIRDAKGFLFNLPARDSESVNTFFSKIRILSAIEIERMNMAATCKTEFVTESSQGRVRTSAMNWKAKSVYFFEQQFKIILGSLKQNKNKHESE